MMKNVIVLQTFDLIAETTVLTPSRMSNQETLFASSLALLPMFR